MTLTGVIASAARPERNARKGSDLRVAGASWENPELRVIRSSRGTEAEWLLDVRSRSRLTNYAGHLEGYRATQWGDHYGVPDEP